MNGGEEDSRPASSRFRVRFSLLALMVFVALIALSLAWLVKPRRVVATALFEVASTPSAVFRPAGNPAENEREYELLKKTQLALLKSNFVLSAAMRNPRIGGMSLLGGKSDPVAWLQEHLVVEYPQDGQILSISLPGTEAQSDELVRMVDAVAKAYKDEVVNERRQRQYSWRDLLARNLENLNGEIKRKLDDYLDISRESGRSEGSSGQVVQEITAKRLERVEGEIIRLETELAINSNGDAPKRKALEQRISELRKQSTALTDEVKSRAERSSDLEIRDRELQQLQAIANDMTVKLESLDIDASSPDQIRQVQQAVPSPK